MKLINISEANSFTLNDPIGAGSSSTIWACGDQQVLGHCNDIFKMEFYKMNSGIYGYHELDNSTYVMKKYEYITDIPTNVIHSLVGMIQLLINSNDLVMEGRYLDYDTLVDEFIDGYFKSFNSILKYVDAIKKYIAKTNEYNNIVDADIKIEHIMRDNNEFVIIDPICSADNYYDTV